MLVLKFVTTSRKNIRVKFNNLLALFGRILNIEHFVIFVFFPQKLWFSKWRRSFFLTGVSPWIELNSTFFLLKTRLNQTYRYNLISTAIIVLPPVSHVPTGRNITTMMIYAYLPIGVMYLPKTRRTQIYCYCVCKRLILCEHILLLLCYMYIMRCVRPSYNWDSLNVCVCVCVYVYICWTLLYYLCVNRVTLIDREARKLG